MSHYSSSLPWAPYETMNTFPGQWDLSSTQSEHQIVSYYNSILAQQLSHHTTYPLAGNGAISTSSRHSISSTTSPTTPRHSNKTSHPSKPPTTPTRPSFTETPSSKEARRREQNRASQRAYRDRKDKQLKALEVQIAQWQSKHQGLCSSYTKQTSEVRKLKAQIEELTGKIIAVQTNLLAQIPIEFDMVPGYEYDWDRLE